MSTAVTTGTPPRRSLGEFLREELKPRGPIFTPFNMISAPIILAGMVLVVIRFWKGIGAVTNLNQNYPWGLWIGFDVMTGVAFAGGAYILTAAVYILHADKYHSIIRATVLNGLLSYMFYAGALMLDLGRPWHIVNPIIGNRFGYNSILFLVAWHFLLYMTSEFLEFSPAIAEWLWLPRLRRILAALTLPTVIFGVTLSCLHQSGLGALFLFNRNKLHPLWYTEFLPVLFLVSSVFAGLSMVIFEGSITHRVFRAQIDPRRHHEFDDIVIGLARGAAATMYVYLFFKLLVFVHGKHWHYLGTKWGAWWLVEIVGFVAIPLAIYTHGYQARRIGAIRLAAVLTLIGIILNRLNVCMIAFNWKSPVTYVPAISEVVITLMVVFLEIWAFRWIVHRLPVLREPPAWAREG